MKRIVHIVGTGTIGEPLIGLFTDFRDRMGIDEVTFHKRTPLASDKSRLRHLMERGAKLAVDEDVREQFEKLGHEPSYDAREALERLSEALSSARQIGARWIAVDGGRLTLIRRRYQPGDVRDAFLVVVATDSVAEPSARSGRHDMEPPDFGDGALHVL